MNPLPYGFSVLAIGDGLKAAAGRALDCASLRSEAQMLGLAPKRADVLLAQVQGEWVGSTPTTEDIAAARSLIIAEAMGPAPAHPDPLALLLRQDPG
ncbi:hypothetical protein OG401_21105 [Kitasatospora purpeofusca]|uniref:hypothetical protein n=1 Tax=Kitasatospora purpeofusca TaxID=67352 RepID=UPI00225286EB|nr:hypothetical protein [Kitasatospora purpeofusca]MCX4686780.1 hypothetical protein [Kitasatospora purpeofusca]